MKSVSKNPSDHMHKCFRQNCYGAENAHPNYISVTSRQATPTHSKKKKSKTHKNAIKQIIEDTYNQLKIQNEQLKRKLNHKNKKYQEVKNKLKSYQLKIANYEHDLDQGKSSANKKYNQIITASQNLSKQTLERYKMLQEEYNKYKESTEKKIAKLQKQKDFILKQSQRNYAKEDQSIQDLRKELKRIKQQQITSTSLKNLGFIQKQSNLSKQNQALKQEIESVRLQYKKIKNYNQNLQTQLRTLNIQSRKRQDQLRNSLDIISQKVSNWQGDYQKMKEEVTQWQIRYNKLSYKYQKRRQKQKKNNEQWASIFKQFLIEIDKLKKQLEAVSERNIKLIKMYANQ